MALNLTEEQLKRAKGFVGGFSVATPQNVSTAQTKAPSTSITQGSLLSPAQTNILNKNVPTPNTPTAPAPMNTQIPTPQSGQVPTSTQTPNLNSTGNPQMDAFLQGLPQIQKALGIGVETPEQVAQRTSQTESLNRLIALQESLIKAQAPSSVLTDLDKAIQQQTKALETTTPEELLKSQPSFQNEGITQGQLLRESASRADPIARTLSDLVSSRSILGQEMQRQQESLQTQMSGIQNIASLQGAIAKLAPQQGLPSSIQGDILSALTKQAFQDPLDRQIKQAQLQKLQTQAGVGGQAPLTATQKNRVNQLDAVIKSLDDYNSLYEQNVGTTGVKLTGEKSGRLAGAYNTLLFQIAQAAGTGALQAADREVVESMVPNPTTLGGAFTSVVRGGKGGGKAAIKQAKSFMQTAKDVIVGTSAETAGDIQQQVEEAIASLGL